MNSISDKNLTLVNSVALPVELSVKSLNASLNALSSSDSRNATNQDSVVHSNVSIKFDKSADMFLFVLKNSKNEVIATIPSKEFISMMKRLQQTDGVLLDLKI